MKLQENAGTRIASAQNLKMRLKGNRTPMDAWTYRKINTNVDGMPKFHIYRLPLEDSPIHAYAMTEEQAAKIVGAFLTAEQWSSLMAYCEQQKRDFLKRFGVPEVRWNESK